MASTRAQKPKGRAPRNHTPAFSRVEVKQAQARLAEMGYGTGRNALIAFQKWEGRKVTGQLSRDEVDAIMKANAPQAKDSGYK
ncbi:MAG: peptidoglycan-binding domain-containing protein, partial [Acidobacteriota bacterium]